MDEQEFLEYFITGCVESTNFRTLHTRLLSISPDFERGEQRFKELDSCYVPDREKINSIENELIRSAMYITQMRIRRSLDQSLDQFQAVAHLRLTNKCINRIIGPVQARIVTDSFVDATFGNYLEHVGFKLSNQFGDFGYVFKFGKITLRLSQLYRFSNGALEDTPINDCWLVHISCIDVSENFSAASAALIEVLNLTKPFVHVTN